MSFEPSTDMPEALAAFKAALKAAHEKGVQDGIARIIQAAKAPLDENDGGTDDASKAVSVSPTDTSKRLPIKRAPRGLVPKIVGQMLTERPGNIIAEYEQMKDDFEFGSRISEKSVGNELRRYEGTKYRRDDVGGWWPIVEIKEAADTATNDKSATSAHSNQGGPIWNRPSQ